MRRTFLNVSLFAGTLLVLFMAWLFFSSNTRSVGTSGNNRFIVVMNKPYFVTKDEKTLLVYDRVFYNEAEEHLIIKTGMICLYGHNNTKFCSNGQVNYFLGPSSDIVQTNQYFVLKEDTEEIHVLYEGEFAGGETGSSKLVLSLDENRNITVKEGAPIQFEVIR